MITCRLEHADGHDITPRDYIFLRECPIAGDLISFAGAASIYRVLSRKFLEIPANAPNDGSTLDVILRVRQDT